MTAEQYGALSISEKLIYDELCTCTKKIVERVDVLTEIVKKAIEKS